MIHTVAAQPVYIGIISANRASNAQAAPVPATWHVPAEQLDLYASQGVAVAPDGAAGPSGARNSVLEVAQALGVGAIILDDDTIRVDLAINGKAIPIHPMRGLATIVRATHEHGKSLGTSAYFQNAYFLGYGPVVQFHGNPGVVAYVPPEPAQQLRYDTNLRFSEDFDFAMQHHVYGKGFVVCRDVFWKFRHRDKGGLSDKARANECAGVKASNDYLLAKWGDLVRVNRNGGITQPRPKAASS